MMSSLADTAIWIALVVTSGLVLLLRHRLRSLGRDLADYRLALGEITVALTRAEGAVRNLVDEGQGLAATLARRIAEARVLAGDDAGKPASGKVDRVHDLRNPDAPSRSGGMFDMAGGTGTI